MAEEHRVDVVCLARATSPQTAHVWRQALEAEGIYCKVVGDYLDAGMGTLDTIPAEVWVRKSDVERARAILDTVEPLPEEEP